MKVDQKIDEASLSSMITGFLAGRKKAMKKNQQKDKISKKIQKFWDESIYLVESVLNEATEVRAKHPSTGEFLNGVIVGITTAPKEPWKTPLNKAQDVYKIKWNPEGLTPGMEEVSEVPRSNVRSVAKPEPENVEKARLAAQRPSQYIGGRTATEKKLSDEHDPQMAVAPEKYSSKLEIPTPESSTDVATSAALSDKDAPPQETEVNAPQPKEQEQFHNRNKLNISMDELFSKIKKRLHYYLNSDENFSREWRGLATLASGGNEEAKNKMKQIRLDIMKDILSSENLSTKAGVETSALGAKNAKLGVATSQSFNIIASKYLSNLIPKLKSGQTPSPEDINFLSNFLGVDVMMNSPGGEKNAPKVLNPRKVSEIIKLFGGKDSITPEEFANSPLSKFINQSKDVQNFLKLPLDVFPAKFADKIERIADKQNIPSAFEKSRAGEIGGVGYGLKRFLAPKFEKDPKKIEAYKSLDKALISRSKTGFTKLRDALAEMPPEEAQKLLSYFMANKEEISDALKNRVNRSPDFSRQAIGKPGEPEFSKLSLIGSNSPKVPFNKKEIKDIQSAQSAQQSAFDASATNRLANLMSQDEDSMPIASAPSYKVDEKHLPSLTDLWSRIYDVSKQGQGGIVDDVIQRAAEVMNAEPADISWVLTQMIKRNKRTGEIIGLKDPSTEPIENLDEEEMSLAPKLYYALSSDRLKSTKVEQDKDTKKRVRADRREDRNIQPHLADFAQSQAEKIRNISSLEKAKSETDEEMSAQEKARQEEEAKLKKSTLSPDEIESISTRERLGRSKVAAGLRDRRRALSTEEDKLRRELKAYIESPEKLPEEEMDLLKTLASIENPESFGDKKLARRVKQAKKYMDELAKSIKDGESIDTTRGLNNLLIAFAKARTKNPIKYRRMLATVMRPIKLNWFDEEEPLAARIKSLSGVPKEKDMYIPDDKFGKPAVKRHISAPQSPGVGEKKPTPRMSLHGGEVLGKSGDRFSYDKESQTDADKRLAKDLVARARKVVAKSGGSLDSRTALKRALSLLLKKKEFESLSDKSPEEIVKLVKESRSFSILEFITIPGKKKLVKTEIKEKDWQKGKPESKKKWAPTIEKKKKRRKTGK